MPWSISYFPDGAEILFSGRTTGEEVRVAKVDFYAHRFEQPARWVLCDFSAVQELAVRPDEVERVVRQDRAHVRTHPELAEVVVAPTPFEFGMARMWENQVDEERTATRVVHTREEADGWLRVHGLRGREERSA